MFEKINDESLKEIKQVETVYTIKELKENIETLNSTIAEREGEFASVIEEFKTHRKKFEDLLVEAEKLGINTKEQS